MSNSHAHSLDPGALAWSASLVMGAAYLLCAVSFWVAPTASLQLFAWMFHILDPASFAQGSVGVTLQGAFWGLVQAVAYTYLFVFLVAKVYNSVLEKK